MGDLLVLLAIWFVWKMCTIEKRNQERAACNRTTPEGYHTDFSHMAEDARKCGKDFVYRKINAGGYDVKDEEKK